MRQLFRVVPIAIAVAFLVPAMTPAVAQAQSVDEQKQKVEDIVDQLERLEERALQIGQDYNDAIDTGSQLDVEIADAETRIAEKEADLAELRANLSDMALRSFVGGGAAPLGPLFEDAANMNDALQREELAKVALSAGDFTTDDYEALRSDIVDERQVLDKKRQQAEQLADSLVDAKQQTEKLTAEYTTARADAEAKLGRLIAEEETRRAEESARRVQEQAQQASSSSGGGSSGGGGST
jgi:septal ring factor EnvC (AmiA/AmiB activator)